MGLLGIGSMEELRRGYRDWIGEQLARQDGRRQSRWTESIAVGSEAFVEKTKAELGIKASSREVREEDGAYELRERGISYKDIFAGENTGLRPENTYLWNISD